MFVPYDLFGVEVKSKSKVPGCNNFDERFN